MSAVLRCTWPMSTPASIGRGPRSTGVTPCVVVSFIAPVYLSAQPSVHRLAPLEHADVLGDPAGPRLGPLRVLDLVQDRVAVRAREPGEEGGRLRIRVELRLQVVGHRGRARRVV